jgi:hypothetical protein
MNTKNIKFTRYSCQILMKLEFSRLIFEKKNHANIKFHENPSSGIRGVPCGRTDGNDEVNKRLFGNSANAPKNRRTGLSKI